MKVGANVKKSAAKKLEELPPLELELTGEELEVMRAALDARNTEAARSALAKVEAVMKER